MQLISKDILKKRINNYIKTFKPNPAVIRLLDWLMNIVDKLPVIEERKQGKWINGNCSECGFPCATDSRLDFLNESEQYYCYNCGARMD